MHRTHALRQSLYLERLITPGKHLELELGLCLISICILQASKRLICQSKQTSKQDLVSERRRLPQALNHFASG